MTRNYNLQQKKILLIVPNFFGYDEEIKTILENKGAVVTMVNADPSSFVSTLVSTAKMMKFPNRFMIDLFERRTWNKICDQKYDCFILICGWAITSSLVRKIKDELLNESSKSILYYWDSRKLLKDDDEKLNLFDIVKTFDRNDHTDNPEVFSFLPLFYIPEYKVDVPDVKEKKLKYDLASVGSYKYDRYLLLTRLVNKNPELKLYIYQYTKQLPFMFHKALRKKYRVVKYKDISFKKKDVAEIRQIYNDTAAVLDIPRKGQNGLTMRVFECLAMKKKIVTTCKDIKNYEFYTPNSIYVLSEDLQLPNQDWFCRPYDVDERTIEKYSLEHWINNLLGVN